MLIADLADEVEELVAICLQKPSQATRKPGSEQANEVSCLLHGHIRSVLLLWPTVPCCKKPSNLPRTAAACTAGYRHGRL